MALSGSLNSSGYQGRCIRFEWSASQSVSNNTSTISWNLKGYGEASSSWYKAGGFKVVIDGSTVYSVSTDSRITLYNGTSITSGTKTISHNSDGTRSFSVYIEAGIYTYSVNCSGSTTFTLDQIPRASTMSFSGNTMESNVRFNISSASSAFTHSLTYQFGDVTETLLSYQPAGTYGWTPHVSKLASQIPNSSSGTGTFKLYTWNGTGVSIGVKSYTFTLNLPNNIIPSVGSIIVEPVAINNQKILVQNKNKLSIKADGCAGGEGSSIKSYTFSGPGISKTTTSSSVSFGTISDTGTLSYDVTVTDTRGRYTIRTVSIECYPYDLPYFSEFGAYRSDKDGNIDQNGAYIKCNYKVVYSSVNNTNSITVKISGGPQITTATDNTVLIDLNGDTTSTFEIFATVTDSYGGVFNSQAIKIFGASRVMNISKDGTGIAFGKMSENNNLFECKWDAKFDGEVSGPSGFSTSSDKRVKKNIKDLDIDIIDSLRPVSYELIQSNDNKIHYGFVAQEINDVLTENKLDPNFIGLIGKITNNNREEYVLTYTEFIPLLTKKCQELQSEVDMLKQEILELKSSMEGII